ncbi:hypothetical protein Tco_0024358 [Tanacetum coccineum]
MPIVNKKISLTKDMIRRLDKVIKMISHFIREKALGLERQPDVAVGPPRAAEDAPVVDEDDQAVLAPVQAPVPPLAAARTMPQRMSKLEEDVHEIHGALAEQREVIGAMVSDFSRFTVWAASGIVHLLDSA